jgi:hypothetical protein
MAHISFTSFRQYLASYFDQVSRPALNTASFVLVANS